MRLRAATVGLLALVIVGSAVAAGSSAPRRAIPRTGFEKSGGAEWTTHEQELKFLAEVDRLSKRVSVSVIGQTIERRPMHLVRLGHPAPHSRREALRQPVLLFVCSQHGNEPAGREACLQALRDLAFTDNPKLVQQLKSMTILFIPSANPDGRVANSRENARGVDINRDHINLESPEARAIAEVVRDWKPELVLDLHEYGPSLPVVYDDDLLYLWPRNLNVDKTIHGMSKHFVMDYIEPGAEERGYSADEYGQYELADHDIHQSAGDGDEGIARNAMGLRHSIGILVESAVTENPRNGPGELTSEAELNKRRVASHLVVAGETLEFLRAEGAKVARETRKAAAEKTFEGKKRSAPVYFGGADNDPPEESEIQDPPPCRYELTQKQAGSLTTVFRLLGIRSVERGGKVSVPMGQPAEPVIPLLLDERGARHAVAGKPVMKC